MGTISGAGHRVGAGASHVDLPPRWKAFVSHFLIACLCALAILLGLVLVADPYDTGRFALLKPRPREAISPRMDMASRGRDPSFDAVIIGNSHIAPISPTRLSQATGIAFASLIAAGSSYIPQLTLLDWYLRHRRGPVRGIVLGVDDFWCRESAPPDQEVPFPSFLFSANLLTYVAGMMSHHSLEQTFARLATPWKRHFRPRPPDGFWDLELDYVWDGRRVAKSLAEGRSEFTNLSGRYPALMQLDRLLASAPLERTAIVLVRPPVWAASLPGPGTRQAQSEDACRAAVTAVGQNHRNVHVIDWRDDREANRQLQDFFDTSHYRAPVAQKIESEIIERLRATDAPLR